jgi:hypothetical protein
MLSSAHDRSEGSSNGPDLAPGRAAPGPISRQAGGRIAERAHFGNALRLKLLAADCRYFDEGI